MKSSSSAARPIGMRAMKILTISGSFLICCVSGVQKMDGAMALTVDLVLGPLGRQLLGEQMDGALGGAVGRVAAGMAEEAAHRADGDDLAAVALLDVLGARVLRAQQGAADVDVHDLLPLVDVEGLGGLAVAGGAGHGDHDVDLAEVLDDLLHGGLDALVVGHVDAGGGGLAAQAFDVGHDVIHDVGLDVPAGDVGAEHREALGRARGRACRPRR